LLLTCHSSGLVQADCDRHDVNVYR